MLELFLLRSTLEVRFSEFGQTNPAYQKKTNLKQPVQTDSRPLDSITPIPTNHYETHSSGIPLIHLGPQITYQSLWSLSFVHPPLNVSPSFLCT